MDEARASRPPCCTRASPCPPYSRACPRTPWRPTDAGSSRPSGEPPRREEEPFVRRHHVTRPFAEPRIAGGRGGAGGRRDHELVCREHELCLNAGCRAGRAYERTGALAGGPDDGGRSRELVVERGRAPPSPHGASPTPISATNLPAAHMSSRRIETAGGLPPCSDSPVPLSTGPPTRSRKPIRALRTRTPRQSPRHRDRRGPAAPRVLTAPGADGRELEDDRAVGANEAMNDSDGRGGRWPSRSHARSRCRRPASANGARPGRARTRRGSRGLGGRRRRRPIRRSRAGNGHRRRRAPGRARRGRASARPAPQPPPRAGRGSGACATLPRCPSRSRPDRRRRATRDVADSSRVPHACGPSPITPPPPPERRPSSSPRVGMSAPRLRRIMSATIPVQPGLVRGAEPSPVVAVEVLVEHDVVLPAPGRAGACRPAERGPAPVLADGGRGMIRRRRISSADLCHRALRRPIRSGIRA